MGLIRHRSEDTPLLNQHQLAVQFQQLQLTSTGGQRSAKVDVMQVFQDQAFSASL